MTNKQQKITHPQPQKRPKNSQLIRLKLEQLNQINGGSGDPSGPEPDFGPDGVHVK
ncbi:MAG: hypothetical protein QNJ72_45600 [Pleurocapsa sp. MO_226.B13]|nr:hypothetical protein [Pleurocapsa sp. MO_226.B13]